MDNHADEYELDPVFVHSLREAKWILKAFCCFACYTVGYCYFFGYQSTNPLERPTADAFGQTLGLPDWILWGIVAPWIAANLVTAWFCFAMLRNDPLEESESLDRDSLEQESQAAEASDA